MGPGEPNLNGLDGVQTMVSTLLGVVLKFSLWLAPGALKYSEQVEGLGI